MISVQTETAQKGGTVLKVIYIWRASQEHTSAEGQYFRKLNIDSDLNQKVKHMFISLWFQHT